MKKLALVLMLSPLCIYAQTGVVQGHCYLGGKQAITSGSLSTNYANGIVPACTVTVYLTGTLTKATITKPDGSALANPFTANTATAVDPGGWIFRAAINQGYDVVMSGGNSNPSCTTAPNCYVQPVTLTDVFAGYSSGGTSNCGSVSGDNTSTDCGYQNRVGDTATIPATVQTYGTQNLGANSANLVVAVGNNNGAANPAPESVLIGDTNNPNMPSTSPLSSNFVSIGNNNQDLATGYHANEVCIGDQNCRSNAYTQDTVAIGNSNFWHNVGTDSGPNNLNVSVAIGLANAQYINTGDTIIGIGQANSGGHAPGGSTNVFEIIGIGDSAAYNVGNTVNDVVAIGDAAAKTIADNSSDIISIGDGSNKQCNNFTGCGSLPNPIEVHDVITIGDVAGSFNQGSDVVAIGHQALGANTLGAGNGLYNTGSFNNAIGTYALAVNTSGAKNVAIGPYAGADGFVDGNTIGNSNKTGSNNTWVGYDAGPNTTNQLSNTVALGYQAHNTASNQVVIGNSSITQNVSYGIHTPGLIYSVAGTPLPSCTSGLKGSTAIVSDASSPTYLGTYTGSSTTAAPVMCNGTNWVTY